jgi:hypothetical protein
MLDMLFGKRDKKSGADWEAFQVLLVCLHTTCFRK